MKKIARIIAAFAVVMAGVVGLMTPAFADDPFCDNLPDDVKPTVGCEIESEGALPKAVVNIINSVIGVGGLVAVIYIVIGGVNYMTSAGDTNKLAKAKTTILYALIGLLITALAFAIVNFALGALDDPGTTSTSRENSLVLAMSAKE